MSNKHSWSDVAYVAQKNPLKTIILLVSGVTLCTILVVLTKPMVLRYFEMKRMVPTRAIGGGGDHQQNSETNNGIMRQDNK